jgi:hypothetical protein
MTPGMVREVKRVVKNWKFDVVAIGYPGPVIHGRPLKEPHNLGEGSVGFVFPMALAIPSESSMMPLCRPWEAIDVAECSF